MRQKYRAVSAPRNVFARPAAEGLRIQRASCHRICLIATYPYVVADDYEQTLAQLETALQVRHIAHRPLITVRAETDPAQAGRVAAERTLNNLRVVGPNNEVIGVLENVNGEVPDVERPRRDIRAVRFSMRPLSDRILVEGHRSLEGLLEDLLQAPYYQLVVTRGRIDGIVTASDVNKAPVRVLAYATVARLETAMAAAIRRATGGDDEAAVSELGEGAAGQVRGDHERLLAGTLNVDLLDATTERPHPRSARCLWRLSERPRHRGGVRPSVPTTSEQRHRPFTPCP
jgi:predicted transcriptional regulator